MKKLIFTVALLIPFITKAQENYLGKNETEIKLKLSTTAAIFDETTYTNTGEKISFFKYPYEHYLLAAEFIYNESGIFRLCWCFSPTNRNA